MKQSEILKLLDNIQKDDTPKGWNISTNIDNVLIIDGLNMFLRNFAVLNYRKPRWSSHVGGLGGFLRSLGSLINNIKPTSVYVVFDGIGSSQNRKNLLPEYKSGRNLS